MKLTRSLFRTALVDTIPVMTGYLTLGAGLGVLLEAKGYGPLFALFMSGIMYAGSAQFLLAGVLSAPIPLPELAVTQFLLNARHIFYGISMIDKYRNTGTVKPYLIFGLTDETYSLAAPKEESTPYYFLVTLLDQIYWVSGTVLGTLVGRMIPFDMTGIDFALTALFVSIFTEQWLSTSDHTPASAGILVSLLCLLIFGPDVFLIPSMIGILAVLLVYRRLGHG